MAFIITCSECQARFKTPTKPLVGQVFKCRRCGEQMTLDATQVTETEEEFAKPKERKSDTSQSDVTPHATSKKSRKHSPKPDDEDDDKATPNVRNEPRDAEDDDDSPKSKSKKRHRDEDEDEDEADFEDTDPQQSKKKKGKKKSNRLLYLSLVGIVVFIGAAVLLFFLMSGGTDRTMMSMTLEETESISCVNYSKMRKENPDYYETQISRISGWAVTAGVDDTDIEKQISSRGESGSVIVTKFSKPLKIEKLKDLGKTSTRQEITYVEVEFNKADFTLQQTASKYLFIIKGKYLVATNKEENIKKLIDNIDKDARLKGQLKDYMSDVSEATEWVARVDRKNGGEVFVGLSSGLTVTNSQVKVENFFYFQDETSASKFHESMKTETERVKANIEKSLEGIKYDLKIVLNGAKIQVIASADSDKDVAKTERIIRTFK